MRGATIVLTCPVDSLAGREQAGSYFGRQGQTMKDRLITIGLVAAGVMAGFLMRGPINNKINSHQMASWINGSCEVKQRMVPIDPEAPQRGKTVLYIHCE